MSSPGHHDPSAHDQSYPPFPGAVVRPQADTASAEHVCFIFPGRRTICRPWRLLQGATHEEEGCWPVIAFFFPDSVARVVFDGADPAPRRRCWQAYLDGRLDAVEDQPGSQWIVIRSERFSDDFDRVYPGRPVIRTRRRVAEDEDVFP